MWKKIAELPFNPAKLTTICAEDRAFLYGLMEYLPIRQHIPTAYFSLRALKEQFASELLRFVSGIHGDMLGEDDCRNLVKTAGILAESPLYVHDMSPIPVSEMNRLLQEFQGDTPKLVLIDDLGLISAEDDSGNAACQSENAGILRDLKEMAKSQNVSVAVLKQISDISANQNRMPEIAESLKRETLGIADNIVFLKNYCRLAGLLGSMLFPPRSLAKPVSDTFF
ncbi:MAG: DnaB-like helicase C-terminal domain-containing protein [Thermodesulfobacteriota bacterium]